MLGFLILVGLIAAAVMFVVGIYNRLVKLRNASEGAFSDIDVQLKRRRDLIPNLVETVKGYASHEQQTFKEVTEARSRAANAAGTAEKASAESALGRAIANVFAVAEAYPELRASENFQQLQAELSKIEDAIQNARRYYNAIVRDLNTAVESFPNNLIANSFGFAKGEYFELDSPEDRQAPQVDFNS